MSETATAVTSATKKGNKTAKIAPKRKAEVKASGYLVLVGRGRPSSKKKYKTVSGQALADLLAGKTVKA